MGLSVGDIYGKYLWDFPWEYCSSSFIIFPGIILDRDNILITNDSSKNDDNSNNNTSNNNDYVSYKNSIM